MEFADDKEWSVAWEDGTIWFPSWIPGAGSFTAERPSGEAIDAFATRGNVDPFAIKWLPELMP